MVTTPLILNRSILDPVHGLVRMTSEEIEILDLPMVQRLRSVRQNGLLHLVFPSATHTRFEHSIGTVFVADSMVSALIHNSQTAARKSVASVKKVDDVGQGEALDLASLGQSTFNDLLRVTRIAALVHDLGHGPLSHTFEKFAPTRNLVEMLIADSQSDLSSDLWRTISAMSPTNDRVKHEEMSCVLFGATWGARDPELVRNASAVVLGEFGLCQSDILRPWLPMCHDIIASAPADADRMDYLERDSRSFGVNYGLFDRNRLLKSFLCYKENGHFRLGIKQSGLRAVENFVQARFELHAQVYYHKTNRATELMLDRISDFGGSVDFFESIDNLEALAARYAWLTDERLMSALAGDEQITVPADVSDLADGIRTRSIWKRVYDCDGPEHAEKILALLRNDNPGAELLHDKVEPKATKDLEDGARLLRRNEFGIYSVGSGRSWLQESPLMKALNDQEKSVHRIFLRSADAKLASQLRQAAEKFTLSQAKRDN